MEVQPVKYYDVVCIGSGPASCAAAITSQKAGLSTLLITKKEISNQSISLSQKEQPVESVHPGIFSLISTLNFQQAISESTKGTYKGIDVDGKLNLFEDGGLGNSQGLHLNRNIFDFYLLQTCLDEGVQVLPDQSVNGFIKTGERIHGIVTSKNEKIRSRYIIDGSGPLQIGGRLLKFQKTFLSPPLKVSTSVIEFKNKSRYATDMAYFRKEEDGWLWLAFESEKRCSWTRLAGKYLPANEIPGSFSEIIYKAPISIHNRRWRIFRPLYKPGVILCGDAAGILDPAAGQGILLALYSGMKAASCVAEILVNESNEEEFLQEYDQWFFHHFVEIANQLKTFYSDSNLKNLVKQPFEI